MGLRGLDFIEMGDYVHVSNHAVEGQSLFVTPADREVFLELLARVRHPDVVIVAWSLVGNHFHLLLKLQGSPKSMSTMLQRLQGRYAKYFNRTHGRRGALFWGRYDRRPVPTEMVVCIVIAYIHANRTKDGFCTDPDTDPWSSHPDYLGSRDWQLVDLSHRDALFGSIESYGAAFRDLLPRWSDADPAQICEKLVADCVRRAFQQRPAELERYLPGIMAAALTDLALLPRHEAARGAGLTGGNNARTIRRARRHCGDVLAEVASALGWTRGPITAAGSPTATPAPATPGPPGA